MGRHSGFWMAAALTGVTALATTLRLSAGGASIPGNRLAHDRPSASLSQFSTMQYSTPDDERVSATAETDDSRRSVTLTSIPAGALIIIGSIDTSGARHTVRIDAGASDSSVAFAESFQAPVRMSQHEVPRESYGMSHNEAEPQAKSHHDHGPGFGLHRSEIPAVRHFLIPQFVMNSTEQRPAAAVQIAETARVAVFLDAELCDTTEERSAADSPGNQNSLAQRICDRLESDHLDQVTHWIGPIDDVDGDRRLTIVLTELDRRAVPDDTPILGCVRDRDFAPSAYDDGLAGDIIYLNHRLPGGAELDALLVHELVHAAICCLRIDELTRSQLSAQPQKVSAWLNEAIAHVLEMKLAASSTGFADRMQQFQSEPATSPIVADQNHLSFVARRSGSRAAAALFLAPHIDSPDDIAVLCDERSAFSERFQTVSGRSFADEFRAWSISHAVSRYPVLVKAADRSELQMPTDLRNDIQSSCRLYGTAFIAFRCRASIDRLIIASDDESQLQITILE